MEVLLDMWNADATYTLWQAIWISSIFAFMNLGLCFFIWLGHKDIIIQCGYRKSSRKKVRKVMKDWPLFDKILLRRLVTGATESNPILFISLILNYLDLLASVSTLVGYVGAILTRGSGWAMTLVLCSGFVTFFLSGCIHFVCDLIWIPSERKRWKM